MYLGLFVILRFMVRRQASQFEPADLLVIVLIADAAQNGLGKEYQSVTEGLVLLITIVAWEYLLDWLAYRYSALRLLLKPAALTLIRKRSHDQQGYAQGNAVHRRACISIRQHDVEDISLVKLAKLEGDGRLSIIRRRL